ncbi:MAG TPA: diacylglycerol kinase family protein [bacterium]|nr:diacylglycerol kinase family protein [bacterium]HPJ71472.1 diacylglycerol kinase family protein [bacterium]HPQ66029.1 diacylglycerol kinase family protein [bacterium]
MKPWLGARVRSFRHAGSGWLYLLRREANFKIHVASAAAVGIAGTVCGVRGRDWLWLAAAVTAVLVAEAFNSALEALADACRPEADPRIRRAKDIAAAAVLLAAVFAAAVGAAVFIPRIFP